MIRNVVRAVGGRVALKAAGGAGAAQVPAAARAAQGLRAASAGVAQGKGSRSFSESAAPAEDVRTAQHAWEKSCYFNIDYKIDEGSTVYDAISRMSAYNVGCLIVTKNGVVSGIISERDYVCKIALLGKASKDTTVKEICTRGPKMVAAKRSDTIEACVKKMIAADVRHLPVIDDDTGEVFGLISVKASHSFFLDLVKEYTKERDDLLCK
ncbi:unnamed protein product, partial [Hapterophycus canaliculatus]